MLDAVVNYYNKDNANPHRGVYDLAMRATDAHGAPRHPVAEFLRRGRRIVFTQNTIEALNLVAYSYGMHFLHAGDEIVLSVAEHHPIWCRGREWPRPPGKARVSVPR